MKRKIVHIPDAVNLGRRGKEFVIALYGRKATPMDHRNVCADNRVRGAAKRQAIEED